MLQDYFDGPEGEEIYRKHLEKQEKALRSEIAEYLAERQRERADDESAVQAKPEVNAMTRDQWQAYRKSLTQLSTQMELFDP
jgi:hypothetical protein